MKKRDFGGADIGQLKADERRVYAQTKLSWKWIRSTDERTQPFNLQFQIGLT